MRMSRCPAIQPTIRQIELAVQHAEQAAKGKKVVVYGTWESFPSFAPRNAVYAASSARLFLNVIQDLHLPRTARFADLGSGAGLICATAGIWFTSVTGFEVDQRLLTQAKSVVKKLDLPHVRFRDQDFLEADLTEFDIIYFFHPFITGIAQLMKAKLAQTKPGTLIIANTADVIREEIFDQSRFQRIYSLQEDSAISVDTNMFTTFRRL